jgi:uncharacterized membrane-anchored protein
MKRGFYAIVVLQLLFLLGEAATNEMALRGGRVVTLRAHPVDPRSLFMGNYLALSYDDISTINLATIRRAEPAGAFRYGRTVYVGIEPRKPWAIARVLTTSRPPRQATMPYLRGRVTGIYESTIDVQYGLERYFIPETVQRKVNRLQWAWGRHRPRITVEVSLGRVGQGLIRRVLVDGAPLQSGSAG